MLGSGPLGSIWLARPLGLDFDILRYVFRILRLLLPHPPFVVAPPVCVVCLFLVLWGVIPVGFYINFICWIFSEIFRTARLWPFGVHLACEPPWALTFWFGLFGLDIFGFSRLIFVSCSALALRGPSGRHAPVG